MLQLIKYLPFLLLAAACNHKTVSNTGEYNAWLQDPVNGCRLSKEVNDMIIEVKYLPPSYLALKESAGGSAHKYDSLAATYRNSTTFLVSFKPKEGHKGNDVMFDKIEDYKGYIERAMELNFDLESKMLLNTDKGSFHPVLSSLENTYGLTKGRQVSMVFAADDSTAIPNSDWFDFVYTDNTYDLGILHFKFNYELIKKNLPKINLPNP